MRVVPAFQPLKDRHLRFGLTAEVASIEQFSFQRGKEALRHGVVCALQRRTSPVGEIPTRPLSLRPEALGAGQEATNGLKHFKKTPLQGGKQSVRAVTRSEHCAGPEKIAVEADRPQCPGRPPWSGKRAGYAPDCSTGVVVTARMREDLCATREVCKGASPAGMPGGNDWPARDAVAPGQMADGLVIPMRPGNAGGGKEP